MTPVHTFAQRCTEHPHSPSPMCSGGSYHPHLRKLSLEASSLIRDQTASSWSLHDLVGPSPHLTPHVPTIYTFYRPDLKHQCFHDFGSMPRSAPCLWAHGDLPPFSSTYILIVLGLTPGHSMFLLRTGTSTQKADPRHGPTHSSAFHETGSGAANFLSLESCFGLNLDEASMKGLTWGGGGQWGGGLQVGGGSNGPGLAREEKLSFPAAFPTRSQWGPTSAGCCCCSAQQASVLVALASSPRFWPCVFLLS